MFEKYFHDIFDKVVRANEALLLLSTRNRPEQSEQTTILAIPWCPGGSDAAIDVAQTARSLGGVEVSFVTSDVRPSDSSFRLSIPRPDLS